jgi:reverse gyrase
MNMDDSDNFPFDEDGKLLTRSQYVSTMIRVYGTVFSTTMDLQTEDITSYANEQYDQLQAEQPQMAANVLVDSVQPDHATGEQPTAEDQQWQWVFTQIINLLQMDRVTNPRLYLYVASAVIQEIDTSQMGNPEDIATALIAQADASYDARQATAPAAATSDSDTTTGDPSQAEANATEQLTEDNK